jgi:two-component system nitrate/nitrite response regulator NarL
VTQDQALEGTMRVLLIDDHALFREGLSGLLARRDIDVIDTVADGTTGLRVATEANPDIILLDMRMPQMDGLDVLCALRKEGITAHIVILTTSQDEQDLLASLRNGAQGYLLKDIAPDDLVSALRRVMDGDTVVAPQLTGALARAVGGIEQGQAPLADLTPRELQILKCLAEGRSNKVIARTLSISDGTVKLHVKAILRKLHVNSRVEAAVMAVEQGLTRHTTPRR